MRRWLRIPVEHKFAPEGFRAEIFLYSAAAYPVVRSLSAWRKATTWSMSADKLLRLLYSVWLVSRDAKAVRSRTPVSYPQGAGPLPCSFASFAIDRIERNHAALDPTRGCWG
jgi:hypothetical protein